MAKSSPVMVTLVNCRSVEAANKSAPALPDTAREIIPTLTAPLRKLAVKVGVRVELSGCNSKPKIDKAFENVIVSPDGGGSCSTTRGGSGPSVFPAGPQVDQLVG